MYHAFVRIEDYNVESTIMAIFVCFCFNFETIDADVGYVLAFETCGVCLDYNNQFLSDFI